MGRDRQLPRCPWNPLPCPSLAFPEGSRAAANASHHAAGLLLAPEGSVRQDGEPKPCGVRGCRKPALVHASICRPKNRKQLQPAIAAGRQPPVGQAAQQSRGLGRALRLCCGYPSRCGKAQPEAMPTELDRPTRAPQPALGHGRAESSPVPFAGAVAVPGGDLPAWSTLVPPGPRWLPPGSMRRQGRMRCRRRPRAGRPREPMGQAGRRARHDPQPAVGGRSHRVGHPRSVPLGWLGCHPRGRSPASLSCPCTRDSAVSPRKVAVSGSTSGHRGSRPRQGARREHPDLAAHPSRTSSCLSSAAPGRSHIHRCVSQ